MSRLFAILGFIGLLWVGMGASQAAVCTLPYILQNGTIPDATQVMADFYALENCVTSGSGSVSNLTQGPCLTLVPNPITTTGIIEIASPLPVMCGGTGRTTLTANSVLLGEGTAAVNFAAPGTAGYVLTSNGAADPSFQAPAVGGCGGSNQVACLNLDQAWTARQEQDPVPLTDGATISTNAALRNYFSVTITGASHTLANPTNLEPGNYVWFI